MSPLGDEEVAMSGFLSIEHQAGFYFGRDPVSEACIILGILPVPVFEPGCLPADARQWAELQYQQFILILECLDLLFLVEDFKAVFRTEIGYAIGVCPLLGLDPDFAFNPFCLESSCEIFYQPAFCVFQFPVHEFHGAGRIGYFLHPGQQIGLVGLDFENLFCHFPGLLGQAFLIHDRLQDLLDDQSRIRPVFFHKCVEPAAGVHVRYRQRAMSGNGFVRERTQPEAGVPARILASGFRISPAGRLRGTRAGSSIRLIAVHAQQNPVRVHFHSRQTASLHAEYLARVRNGFGLHLYLFDPEGFLAIGECRQFQQLLCVIAV